MSTSSSGKARTAAQVRQDNNRDQGGRFSVRTWEQSAQSIVREPVIADPIMRGESHTRQPRDGYIEPLADATIRESTFRAEYDGPFDDAQWEFSNCEVAGSTFDGSFAFSGGSVVQSKIMMPQYGSLDGDGVHIKDVSVNVAPIRMQACGDATLRGGSTVDDSVLNTSLTAYNSTLRGTYVSHLADSRGTTYEGGYLENIATLDGGSITGTRIGSLGKKCVVEHLGNVEIRRARADRVEFNGSIECPDTMVEMACLECDFTNIPVTAKSLKGNYLGCAFDSGSITGRVEAEMADCTMYGTDLSRATFPPLTAGSYSKSWIYYDDETVFPEGFDKDADPRREWVHKLDKAAFDERKAHEIMDVLTGLHNAK